MGNDSTELFHPLIAEWFRSRYGSPTDAQERAWPRIALGRNVLISAPTGTGKTYSAFLFAIDRLLTGGWSTGAVRVLYVSPLKALANDIRANLIGPLRDLTTLFQSHGIEVPEVAVRTRSGDTPEAERRRMLRRPPEILITTPESLNLLLSSPNARRMLAGIQTVILDEIHSILGSKRGTHLITAVDRLVPLAGEFQRIGLSATVRPLSTAAAFLGGYLARESSGRWTYEPRPVDIVSATQSKSLSLTVRYLVHDGGGAAAEPAGESYWRRLGEELCRIILRRTSTLIFVNSRRLAERLTHEINEGQEGIVAYSHHGSLSRELRSVVEKRMKSGELQAIVATSSLELGIDIGALDEVLLVQTPMSVAGAVQRIGRAGHSVGETSRGTLFASHGMDLVYGAVVASMAVEQDIEETRPVVCPLDVLAQIILSMTAVGAWRKEELFGFLRSTFPYHTLSRRGFDLVVEMLTGRFEDSRIRELKPRISMNGPEGFLQAREGVSFLLYSGGGTIPDRGYFGLRVKESGAKIGELDEEFVWECRIGDSFVLGSQRWRIVSIDHQRVTVVPWQGSVNSSPFWKAERRLRSVHLSERIGETLERCDAALAAHATPIPLSPLLDRDAAAEAERFLSRQRVHTGTALPHRHHILAELTGGRTDARYLLLHTLWGGSVNEPLGLALTALLRRDGLPLDVAADNDTVVITLPDGFSTGAFEVRPKELLERLASANIERLIREELEASGFFGARFRENAGRALLLPRLRVGKRMPLWVTRLRASRLLEQVRRYPDFPIVAETWRECIQDDFDLPSLRRLLGEVRSGTIRISEVETEAPSPFASGIIWLQTNRYLYDHNPSGSADRTGASARGGSLTSELLREMVFTPELRVRIPREISRRFEEKLKRTAPGYAPGSVGELLDWLEERLLIPIAEWHELLEAIERDGGPTPEEIEVACADRIVGVKPPSGSRFIAHLRRHARIEHALLGIEHSTPLARLLREWLFFYGPISMDQVAASFGAGSLGGSPSRSIFEAAVEEVCEEEEIVRGPLLDGSDEIQLCDAENLERLLAFVRRESLVAVETRPLERLVPFLAQWQGLAARAGSGGRASAGPDAEISETAREEALPSRLERLFGFPARADVWETDLLPARLPGYRRSRLDRLLRESDLEWFGCGRRTLSFRFRTDADLLPASADSPSAPPSAPAQQSAYPPIPPSTLAARPPAAPASAETSRTREGLARLFPDSHARFTYWDLQGKSGLTPTEFTRALWEEVWQGHLASDTFDAVRRGALNAFRGAEPRPTPRGGGRRAAFGRWKARTPLSGNWYLQPPAAPSRDPIDALERSKERVRLLLDRYGLLFRELLERELPALHWGALFRTLRLMELSGELTAGRFFDGIPGLQFVSQAALERLRDLGPELETYDDQIYWMNATDPVSPCGLGLPAQRVRSAGEGLVVDHAEGLSSPDPLPSRLPTTHLVYHGPRLVLVSRRLGLDLRINVSPDSGDLDHYLGLFDVLVNREYNPVKSVRVEFVNGKSVRESEYRAALIDFGFEEDFKHFTYRGGRLS